MGAFSPMARHRDQDHEPDSGPERTCIVTRQKGAPDEMIRFVLGPGTIVVPDIRRKLPGRGVWVTARSERVAEAVKRRAFARSFKAQVTASETLPAEIDGLLTADCLHSLSMTNKAGEIVTGFGKVEAAIAAGEVLALVHAIDGGSDGKRKLDRGFERTSHTNFVEKAIELFRSDQLDLALGRTNVIHAALMPGSASRAFLTRCRKLALYRSGPHVAGVSDQPNGSTPDRPDLTPK
jgi:predicted RNA-binding protein YlxR (DUF448 family)